ncbi:MAG: GyrI-like domain-containing protein [Bacteroidetes bacterium]|nr:GyrI-like domain-containing protein [Bacteroidota bacterium]
MTFDISKSEKNLYLPGTRPVFVDVPSFKFFSIRGSGNPNDPAFADFIAVLYSLSYAVKMSPKAGIAPEGYTEFKVYPLEGVWDLSERGRMNYAGKVDKDELVFNLMIRQPDFVTHDFANIIIERTKKKKPHPLLELASFETITDGPSIQMLHRGSYDNEPASFRMMEEFAAEQKYVRKTMVHREIYLSDARRTPAEKLKTILRFQVTI